MAPGIATGLYTAFRDSLVGEMIYHLSGRKVLIPPLCDPDYKVDVKYLSTASTPSEHTIESSFTFTRESQSTNVASEIEKGETDYCMVTWDGEDDVENPQNWTSFKKGLITAIMAYLTTSAYMASAIFTPAEVQMLDYFGTTQVKLMLGLTLFVWGYGIGPIFVSAMSESPLFGGRRYIFIVGQVLFCVFQIPTALSKNLGGFVVLRFLAGLATAPPLCVGPAALGDMFTFPAVSYVMVGWSLGAVCGPYLGPLIGAALTHASSWRWAFWYLLIQAGVALALMLFFLPETSEQALLMRKAQRLRQITGNPNIKAPGDLLKDKSEFKAEIKKILWRPIQMCLREPVLDLINLHLALLYSVIYLFFEAFPIVFIEIYNFTVITEGVAYVGLMTGIFVAVVMYIWHLNHNLVKPITEGHPNTPEYVFGSSAVFGSVFVPVGLFIFGWSSTASAHWMGPISGGFLFSIGTFILFQSYSAYLSNLYPTRFASAIASNTFLRSMAGGAFPLFGTVFFEHTGTTKFPVGWGSSILGFIALAMILLPLYFVKFGEQLREKTLQKYGATQQH